MYDEHFGLTGRPFQLTPDPAFWYETATHRRAMAYLGYGLAQGEGFIVITGDIGAGKTTLMGHLLDTLDREALNPIKLVSTAIEASDLLRIVATELGANPAGLDKAQLLLAIERGLHAVARTGRRTLLIVDEAQALSVGALEELRMLSNFQAGGHALLQIVLLGQPEFRAALHGSERLEQLRQRVIAIHHLEPMAADEVAAYVRHRLTVVGWTGRPGFAESAFAALHRLTDGVPRRLNQLANRVMLHAAIEGADLLTAATVDLVAADLFADLPTMGNAAGEVRGARPAPIGALAEAVSAVEVPAAVEPIKTADSAPPPVAEPLPAVAPEPAPRPFRHSWLAIDDDHPAASVIPVTNTAAPTPAPFEPTVQPHSKSEPATVPSSPFPQVSAPQPTPQRALGSPATETTREPHETPASAGATHEAQPDPAIAARLADLEARMEEQDVALRRVLTLLVDWVETDQAPRPAHPPIEEPRGYVPIRGAAA